jgi:hypothetical protein
MRWPIRPALLLACVASPAVAQLNNPPAAPASVDTSNLATQQQLQDAMAAAAQAKTAADTANSSLAAVQAKADAANAAAAAAQTAVASSVKTVNGSTPTNGNVAITIPTPSNTMPPGVSDAGSLGTMTTMYALANHTHASKARKVIADTAADGSLTWTFASPFTAGTTPVCAAVAQVAAGVTDVVNVQIIGAPTATSAQFLVNRANRTVASLLGLTVLSIPASPGVTRVHAICLEP